MTEEAAFLDAIAAAPEDTALRLCYADWLEERGDGRSEYLRLLAAFEGLERDAPTAAEVLDSLHRLQLREGINRRWVVLMCRGLIARVLRAFQDGTCQPSWPDRDEYRQLARRVDALPLYSDMGGGIILLRPDGELLVMELDDAETEVQAHRGWRLVGLFSGAEFFPELRPLLPPRPSVASACHACNGIGMMRWQGERPQGITACGRCWGLGWLPERPASAPTCATCGGRGRRLLNGQYSSCGDCYGWGWVAEEFV